MPKGDKNINDLKAYGFEITPEILAIAKALPHFDEGNARYVNGVLVKKLEVRLPGAANQSVIISQEQKPK